MQSAIDKLRELRALHEDGLLSSDEFDLRKNAILDAAYAAPPAHDAAPTRAGTELGLMAGQELGPRDRRYRLERLIAHGGMGQVWQATDLATHEELGHSAQVALKILPPHLTRSTRHAKLLIEEATRARRLAHEHIVRVYEWAQDPATASYFIIMEYLEGEDLDSLLAREGPLPLARAVDLLAPVAQALDYAWDRHRLVHRDIKPGNVFLTRRGEVKLLDFGIAARARSSGGGVALEAPASSGTAGYRAPEAGTRRQPARTLDVYAVAVMLRQMTQGTLPAAASQVLDAGCATDPARRPASVSELVRLLREAGSAQAPAAAPDAGMAPLPAAPAPAEPAPSRKPAKPSAAQALLARQLRERERAQRAAAEVQRRERKEALRQQLLARREMEVEKTRLAQEAAQRKAHQARAAAAYLAQQEPALTAPAEVRQAEPAAPAPASPALAPGRVLRDRFLDGGGDGPELVLLAAGRFQMGSPDHERAMAAAAGAHRSWLARETPRHWVGVQTPFAMGRYPVTVGEWRAFVQATGWQGAGQVDWEAPGFVQTDRHPVVGVSWRDANLYLQWLSECTGKAYRLPSEAEWEYACRAGTGTAFSFGDAISTDLANYDGNFTWNGGPKGIYRRGTTPVGTFAPNPWGLFDMHGNVWEWVQDVVHDDYEGAPADGSAWEEGGDQGRRVLRGGCWLYNPRYLRSALRNGFSALMCNDIVGFRVVRQLL